jgi:hypothetical protein
MQSDAKETGLREGKPFRTLPLIKVSEQQYTAVLTATLTTAFECQQLHSSQEQSSTIQQALSITAAQVQELSTAVTAALSAHISASYGIACDRKCEFIQRVSARGALPGSTIELMRQWYRMITRGERAVRVTLRSTGATLMLHVPFSLVSGAQLMVSPQAAPIKLASMHFSGAYAAGGGA